MASPDRSAEGAQGASGAPKSLGGGAEAAEGVHGLQQNDAGASGGGDRPTTQRTGGSDVSTDGASAADRSGSEPLPRNREHAPSYGGAGGAPRTSSDQREPADSRGDRGQGGDKGGSADRIPDDPEQRPVNPT
jgi:hypothetical protein